MPKPAADVDVAFQLRATRASLRPYAHMNEDAIIANAPGLLDNQAVALPCRKEVAEEGHDLLASVAGPRLRERTNGVVVALGFPESGDQRREVSFGPPIEVAPHDLDVLLPHRLLGQPGGFEG